MLGVTKIFHFIFNRSYLATTKYLLLGYRDPCFQGLLLYRRITKINNCKC